MRFLPWRLHIFNAARHPDYEETSIESGDEIRELGMAGVLGGMRKIFDLKVSCMCLALVYYLLLLCIQSGVGGR
jgi:hypothetical protein